MNNIADANATEMRGWVMLMLQRAAENVNPSECNDPAVLLACSLGSDSCPAACVNKSNAENEEEGNTPSNISDMPVAGDLTIAVADYSSSVRSIPMAGTVIFNAVDFKSSEKVVIESVKLERAGLSDKSAIKGVWFEKDGIAVSAKASLSSDGTVTTRFYNNYSVNGTDTLDLVVDLNAKTAGAEIAFKIVGATTTAKNVSLNTETSTYRTTDYKVAEIAFDYQNQNSVEYKVGDSKTFEIGKFKLTNDRPSGISEDRDVVVKTLKLKNNGTLDLGEALKNVYVTRDSKTVSKSVELNNKDLIIHFDNEEIVSGKSNTYTIFTEIAQLNETEKTVKLSLNKESDLVANEKSSNFRVSVTKKATLGTYTFKGGKVTFTNDSKMSKTVNSAAGSSDVAIAKGTLTISEPVKLGKIVFKTDESRVKRTEDGASSIIKDLKLEIGGSTYYTEVVSCTDYKAGGSETNNATKCIYRTTDEEIYLSKTSDIRVLLNIRNDAKENATVDFLGYLNGTSISYNDSETEAGRYDNSDESILKVTEIAGSVQYAKLTVKAGKLNLTNKTSTTQKVVKGNSDEVTLFDGEITAKEGTVSVNEIRVLAPEFEVKEGNNAEGAYKLANNETIDLTVYVNGESFSTISFRGNEEKAKVPEYKSFSSLGDVKSDTSMKIKITAQPTIERAGEVTFKIQAFGSDSQGNAVESTQINTAKLEMTANSEATVANSNASSTVVKDGSNAELLNFTATIKNGSYDLSQLSVKLSKNTLVSNATLSIDGTDVDSANSTSDGDYSYVDFTDVNETLAVGTHTFVVKANLNAKSDNASKGEDGTHTAANKLSVQGVWLSNGSVAAHTADNYKSLSANKLVANAYPVISASTSSDDLILKIENPKDNEDTIDILGFTVNGGIITASLNEKVLSAEQIATLSNVSAQNVSVAPGNSVEFRVQAGAGQTVQVTAIKIQADKQIINIDSDYTNVGKWTSFKVTSNKDATNNSNQGIKQGDATSLELNKASVSVTKSAGDNHTADVTATLNAGSTATISALSSDSEKASVSVNNNIITVTGHEVGEDIVVTVKAGSLTKTFTVNVTA